MTEQFRASGLLARLLAAWPPRLRKRWADVDVDPATVFAYAELLRKLHALTVPADPATVPLSAPAEALWVSFFDEWNRDAEAVSGDLAAAFGKLEGYAARQALVHHAVGTLDAAPSPVSEASMAAGITLARWVTVHGPKVTAVQV
jgi:hypothetical protein